MIRILIAERLKAQGWTAYRLAQELERVAGLAGPAAYRLARGDVRQLKLSTLEALCQALECQPGDILVYKPGRSKPKKGG